MAKREAKSLAAPEKLSAPKVINIVLLTEVGRAWRSLLNSLAIEALTLTDKPLREVM